MFELMTIQLRKLQKGTIQHILLLENGDNIWSHFILPITNKFPAECYPPQSGVITITSRLQKTRARKDLNEMLMKWMSDHFIYLATVTF